MQTMDFELAKWLKEHGVKQHSYFWYHAGDKLLTKKEVIKKIFKNPLTGLLCFKQCFTSTFTLDEILEMLPSNIQADSETCTLELVKIAHEYFRVGYNKISDEFAYWNVLDSNPAQAAGLLLKWCIENGYVRLN